MTTAETDGTIDIAKVDKQWDRNTDRAQQRKSSGATKAVPKAALDAVADTLSESGNTAPYLKPLDVLHKPAVIRPSFNLLFLVELISTNELIRPLNEAFMCLTKPHLETTKWPTNSS
jgi:hypothetical protein